MNIIRFDKISSTQDYAKANYDKISLPAIIIAKEQKEGKGRYRRIFYSPKGGLYFTLVIKLDTSYVSQIVPLSIVEALEDYGITSKIVWPNDIVYEDKKLGGILVEKKDSIYFIGIGLNCNNTVLDFPKDIRDKIITTFEISRKNIDLESLCTSIVEKILSFSTYPDVMNTFTRKLKGIGKNVIVNIDDNKIISGVIIGVSENGALILKKEDKIIEINSAFKVNLF